jgi:hypothetical protein
MGDGLLEVFSSVAGTLLERGRDDLAERVRAATARAARPSTIVCVVGEFKQGKSLLVNALLGRPICPVDDDLATATITLVKHAAETSVTVVRRRGGREERLPVDPATLRDWVTEDGDPAEREGIERVVISFDHPLLARGLTIVDTPGVGGLLAGHGRAALSFLPYADALLFVTDASAEISDPERAFLEEAADRCPDVTVAVSKTDLFPQWRRIVELDRGHLDRIRPNTPVVAVSSSAAIAALRRGDEALAAESGIPQLRVDLLERVVDRSRDRARRRSVGEVAAVVDHLIAVSEEELEVVQDPDRIAAANARYQDAVQRLETVRGPGSRWQQVLGDRMSDASSQASFAFRSGLRDLTARVDREIEELDTSEAWDALAERLQADVAALLADVFGSLDEAAASAAIELSELIADETSAELGESQEMVGAFVEGLRSDLDRTPDPSGVKKAVKNVVPALRGAQSGLMMFGLLGRFLPVGAAGLMMSNPVMLVIGAAFAGKQVMSIRQRSLQVRRQQARTSARTFLDEVRFEAGQRLSDTVRVQQRALRDHFAARVTELQRAYKELAERTRSEAAHTYEQQAARAQQLRADLERLRGLRDRLAEAGT